MFGVGSTEMVLFCVVVLIAVGPERLPTLMRTVGKALRDVRIAARQMRNAMGLDDLMDDETFKVRMPDMPPTPQALLEKALQDADAKFTETEEENDPNSESEQRSDVAPNAPPFLLEEPAEPAEPPSVSAKAESLSKKERSS